MTAEIPKARSRHLRACLLCSIVLDQSEFSKHGCPNCEEILQLRTSSRLDTCITPYFDGIIAVIDPENSWVAKWQRTSKYVRGMYAVRVKGRIPEEVLADLESRNIKYLPRDQTEPEY
ncbi:transcription initiation protein spt4 [Mycena floridula]|nr:transcription initiation protein spt4 [Mycena floridula]